MNAKRSIISGVGVLLCTGVALVALGTTRPLEINWDYVENARPLINEVGKNAYTTESFEKQKMEAARYANAQDAIRVQAAMQAIEQQKEEQAAAEEAAQQQNTYSASVQSSGSTGSFQSLGVIDYNGWRVTYYNPSALGTSAAQLGNTTMGSPIEYNSEGVGTYNGMIAVAMPSNYAYGTVVDTPLGTGVVVDHSGGAMDVVANW